MRAANWFWTLLLVAPLALGLPGCGGGEAETPDGDDDKKGGNGKPTVDVALPTAKDPVRTNYLTEDHVAALVLHPKRVLDSDLATEFYKAIDQSEGNGTVDKGFEDFAKNVGFDAKTVEQAIVLVDAEMLKDPSNLFPGMSAPPSGPGPRGESFEGFPDEKTPARKFEKTPAKGPRFEIPPRDDSDDPQPKPADDPQSRSNAAGGEQFVAVAQEKKDETGPPDFPEGKVPPDFGHEVGPPGTVEKKTEPSAIVRFSEAVDQKKFVESLSWKEYVEPKPRLKDDPRKPFEDRFQDRTAEKKEYAGKTYYVGRGGTSFCFPDDKTLLVGREAMLKKMLDAKSVETPLSKRLSTLGAEYDLIVAVAGEPVEQLMSGMVAPFAANVDDQFPKLSEYASKVKSLAITGSITSDPMFTIVLSMADEDSAAGLASLFNEKVVPMAQTRYADVKKSAPKGEIPDDAEQWADDVVASLAASSKGTDFILGVNRPADVEKLPQAFKQYMERQKSIEKKRIIKTPRFKTFGKTPATKTFEKTPAP